MRITVCAHELQFGDVLIGVLTGRPWRQVRSTESVTNWDQDPSSGRAVLVDAVPVGHQGDYYQPIEIAETHKVEIERD